MPVPTWSVGQVLASADVDSWFVPLAAVPSADQTQTGTGPFNDNTLSLPVVASAFYMMDAYIRVNTTNSSNAWTGAFLVPSGSTLTITLYNGSGSANFSEINASQAFGINPGSGSDQAIALHGTLATSVTTGSLQLQWSGGGAGQTVTRRRYSHLVLRRIG